MEFFFFPESLSVPQAKISPTRQTVDERNDAIFNCTVTGSPPPKVRWIRPGKYYDSTIKPGVQYAIKDNSTLIIRNVDYRAPTDAGWYFCSAINAIGWSSRAQAYLTVESKKCFCCILLLCHDVVEQNM